MAKKYYVVWAGRQPGIYTDWNSCKQQVDQFAGAKYKSFKTQAEAEAAFSGKSVSPTGNSKVSRPKKPNNSPKTHSQEEVLAHPASSKIFTDGGCEPNPGNAGSGLALYRSNQLQELWYGLYNPNGTNNTAELNALHQAMLLASNEIAQGRSVAIFCDSKYAIQCITQWAEGWKKRGWKKASGEIKNLELIQTMFDCYQAIKSQVDILHVNGHVGVEGNELADRMSIYAVAQKEEAFSIYRETIDIEAILAMRAG